MVKKVDIKGIEKVSDKFQKFLNEAAKNPVILNDVGEKSADFIRGSVRARRPDYKVDDVGFGWAERRARLATTNQPANTYVGSLKRDGYTRYVDKKGKDTLIPDYLITNHKGQIKKTSSKKSNLTFTGQLLDSLVHKIDTSHKRVTLFFTGMHKPYIGINGQPIDEPVENAEIAKKLNADKRFEFLFASETLKSILRSTIKSGMRRQLSNFRKLSRLLR